jgi:hydroxymethylpyrimidine pyrophosphatase-like HAD family hydrolase
MPCGIGRQDAQPALPYDLAMAVASPTPFDFDALIERFVSECGFTRNGAVMTDLDGTAVHEFEGRITIPKSVSHALTDLRRLGRPIVLNTLRFPLNVIETFGREWYEVSGAPLPLVSLNGSVVGHLHEDANGAIQFEELSVTQIPASTCEAVVGELERILASGIDDVVLFYYPSDWRAGERLWTPVKDRQAALLQRYKSAQSITSAPLDELACTLLACAPSMLFVLLDASHDSLMAYQHVRPNQFVTAQGVTKASGAETAARRLNFKLEASVGAGDTMMDSFLSTVGLALRVGNPNLPFQGRHATVDLAHSLALGEFCFRLADQVRRSGG